MDILLVNPPSHDGDPYGKVIPLGLGSLWAVLTDHNFNAEILDMFTQDTKELIEVLQIHRPKIVGFSCLTEQRHWVVSLVKLTREILPNSLIILGGVHPTFTPDTMLTSTSADLIIKGEGEIPLLEVCEMYLNRKSTDFSQVNSVVYKSNTGEIIENKTGKRIKHLDHLPAFPYHKFEFNKYRFINNVLKEGRLPVKLDVSKITAVNYMSSRGCVYNCSYCSIQTFWQRRYYAHELNRVIQEIIWLKNNKNVEFVWFWDDIFTINKKRIEELCTLLIENKVNVYWGCTTRVDLVDEQLLKLMRRSGCILISYGVESGSQQILDNVQKKTKIEDIVYKIQLTMDLDISARVSLMVGNPGETDETIAETIKLIQSVEPDLWSVNITKIYPGTDLYKKVKQQGLFSDELWLNTEEVPYYTLEHSEEELMNYQKLILNELKIRREIKKYHLSILDGE
ncbi:TPA: cobalamin-dependent protein [Bacillus pseudomycoides]|nr:cobalamin-dependent protein [Bacillus pseudomycoides]